MIRERTIWVVKGLGNDSPDKIKVSAKDTVGAMREKYAKELGVSDNEIELSTDTTRLTDDSRVLADIMKDGETLSILPRAKAGF